MSDLKKKVHVLLEHDRHGHPHGSAAIRLIQPFSSPLLQARFDLSLGNALPDAPVDVLVVDRIWRGWGDPGCVQVLLDFVRRHGVRLVHAIDDNLYDLSAQIEGRRYPTEIACALSRHADRVVVTTEPLGQRARALNPQVILIRNVLDASLFEAPAQARAHQGLRLGYMGTYTHLEDVRMILWPLRKFLQRKDVQFEMVGIGQVAELKGLFGDQVRVVVPPKDLDYAGFARWFSSHCRWDLGLAPLRAGSFNDCKSDLKFLDYTLSGIVGIYSDVPAYAGTVRHGETGWLCDAAADSWLQALNRLADDAALRSRLLAQAREEVLAQRGLPHAAEDWQRCLTEVLA